MSRDLTTVVNLILISLLSLYLPDKVNLKLLKPLSPSLQAVVRDNVQACYSQENFVSFNLTEEYDQNNTRVNVMQDLMNFLRNPCISRLTLQGLTVKSSDTSNVTTTGTLCTFLQSLSFIFQKVIRAEGCQDDNNNHGHLSSDLSLEKDIKTEAGLALALLLRDQLSTGKCVIFVNPFFSGEKDRMTTNIIMSASSSSSSNFSGHDTWMKKDKREKWVSLLMRFFPETTLFWFPSSSSTTTTKTKASSDEWDQIVSVLSDSLTPSCKLFFYMRDKRLACFTHNLSITAGNTFTGVNHTL